MSHTSVGKNPERDTDSPQNAICLHLMSVRYSHGSNTLHSWVYSNSFSVSTNTKSFKTPAHPENKSNCVCHYKLYSEQTNKQTNTVHLVLLNYWCIFAASSRAHRSLCSPVLSCDCGVLNFALASSRSIHRFSSDERSRSDRNGRTCPLTTGQFRDGHHFFF